MPAVLDLNQPMIRDRFDRAGEYIGVKGGYDGFRAFVNEFNESFEIPKGLGDLGVTADRIDDLVAMAIEDPSCGGNPVELTEKNLKALFEAAM